MKIEILLIVSWIELTISSYFFSSSHLFLYLTTLKKIINICFFIKNIIKSTLGVYSFFGSQMFFNMIFFKTNENP